MEDPLCNSSFGSMVTLDYVTPDTVPSVHARSFRDHIPDLDVCTFLAELFWIQKRGSSALPHERRGVWLPGRSPALHKNMNKELCGLVRCFRIYLRKKAKMEITTESPLLSWLVRHCGWILSRYAVRADGRTGYSRLEGRENTSGMAIFGEAIWYKLPKTADLTKLDDRWRTAIWLEKSDRSDEHNTGVENRAVLARSVRRKVEGKRWNERALKLVTGTPWNPRRRYITRWRDTV